MNYKTGRALGQVLFLLSIFLLCIAVFFSLPEILVPILVIAGILAALAGLIVYFLFCDVLSATKIFPQNQCTTLIFARAVEKGSREKAPLPKPGTLFAPHLLYLGRKQFHSVKHQRTVSVSRKAKASLYKKVRMDWLFSFSTPSSSFILILAYQNFFRRP